MIIINTGRDLRSKSNVLEELGTPNRNGSNHAQLSFFTSCELSTLGEIIHAQRHESTPHNGTFPFTSVELFSTELFNFIFLPNI
jgi:hypothetical protein